MGITKSTNKIQFVKANKGAYQDIKAQYPRCIFFAIDDNVSPKLADRLKQIILDLE